MNTTTQTTGLMTAALAVMLLCGMTSPSQATILTMTGDASQTTMELGELFAPPHALARTRAEALAATLNDPFAYDPANPVSPLPFQTINSNADTLKGFNGLGAPVVVAYTFGGSFFDIFFDLYGRDNANPERDNGLVVNLYNGDWVTPVFTSAPFDIVDSAPFHARFTPPANVTADRVSITGPESFTLMEIRGNGNVVPEPASLVLMAAGAGLAMLRRRRQERVDV